MCIRDSGIPHRRPQGDDRGAFRRDRARYAAHRTADDAPRRGSRRRNAAGGAGGQRSGRATQRCGDDLGGVPRRRPAGGHLLRRRRDRLHADGVDGLLAQRRRAGRGAGMPLSGDLAAGPAQPHDASRRRPRHERRRAPCAHAPFGRDALARQHRLRRGRRHRNPRLALRKTYLSGAGAQYIVCLLYTSRCV